MIAVHISASDTGGGAAIAAYRLHQGLRRVGIDSRMIAAEKRTHDETVQPASYGRRPYERLHRRLRARIIGLSFARYERTRPPHLDHFSDDRTAEPRALTGAVPKADLYHLHWVAGLLDYRSFFRAIPPDVPLVWTLHDMNPLTGGCHYTAGCDRFTAGCGACPALGSVGSRDLSAAIFRRKRNAYDGLQPGKVRLVAPSRWLSREASRSALFGRFEITTIPYGLDTAVFQPRNRAVAREIFGIPPDMKVVMFAAQSIGNYRKGLDLLISALDGLNPNGEIGLVSVGGGRYPAELGGRHLPLGELKSERLMSFAYSAADAFVCPTRDDNLPNVLLEAMACGTPVVAFAVGGIPDMVRPGLTGLLAPPGNVGALREAIEAILGHDEQRARMSRECRRVTTEEYRLEIQAERYRNLYHELLEGARSAAPAALSEQRSTVTADALPEPR